MCSTTLGRALIPRGSTVELVVRNDANDQRVLDLDSVVVNGQRYALNAAANPVGTSGTGLGANRTGEYVGRGAVLGAIVGAIAGGGKGAAIGAAAGGGSWCGR